MSAEAWIAAVIALAGFVAWLWRVAYNTGYVRRRIDAALADLDATKADVAAIKPAVPALTRRVQEHEKRLTRLESPPFPAR